MTNPRPGDLLRDDLARHLRDNLKTLLPDGVDPQEAIDRIEKAAHILTMLNPLQHRAELDTASYLRESSQVLVGESLKCESDPAVRALADRIGELVQHLERNAGRADRREAGRGAAEAEPLLPVHTSESSVRHAAGLLVAGVLARLAPDGRMDHGALRNAAWKALRLLSPQTADMAEEKLDAGARMAVETGAGGVYHSTERHVAPDPIRIMVAPRRSGLTTKAITGALESGLRVATVSPSASGVQEHARLTGTGWDARAWLFIKQHKTAPLPPHDLLIIDDAHEMMDETLEALIEGERLVLILTHESVNRGKCLADLLRKYPQAPADVPRNPAPPPYVSVDGVRLPGVYLDIKLGADKASG